MPNIKLSKRIYRLQNRIVRELNDAHIFLEQAQPLLVEAKESVLQSRSRSDKRYYVPSVDRKKFARRTDKELKEIYDKYITSGLFEAFLTNSVSIFESFLADVLFEVFSHYPLKLTQKVPNIPACPDVTAKNIIDAENKQDIFQQLVERHLSNIFRQRPAIYMDYISKIVGVRKDSNFRDYYEISATRDLIVHNDLYVNQLYLDKAGKKTRGELGDRLVVDKSYYLDSLAKLKKVSGAIKRDVEKKYGRKKEEV